MDKIAVIMAGGAGERFWPLSRRTYPKQLLKIAGERSMLATVVDRIQLLIPYENIYIITGGQLKEAIEDELPQLSKDNIIAEPCGRNTSACLALACAYVRARYTDDVNMLVLTADSHISDEAAFLNDCREGFKLSEVSDNLVLFGVRPVRPETGYGYIECGVPLEGGNTNGRCFHVASFREKPNTDTAIEYLKAGNYLWNSGQFIWRTSVLIHAFEEVFPECGRQIAPMIQCIQSHDADGLAVAFNEIPKKSIDYGVLEKYKSVVVVSVSFPWDDIGSWDCLDRISPPDSDQNVLVGNVLALDSSSCTVYTVKGQNREPDHEKLVVAYGVRDLVIVNTDDVTMVFPKSMAQRVKDVVAAVRESQKGKYL
ncbi:MAG: sugar phosphate nucleotidyltransferase [Candidatus Sumerlaeales bacterium]|nr:sugar phosphate nucleotidyltransferase [Candidatus Sumerlaeales bacterium]